MADVRQGRSEELGSAAGSLAMLHVHGANFGARTRRRARRRSRGCSFETDDLSGSPEGVESDSATRLLSEASKRWREAFARNGVDRGCTMAPLAGHELSGLSCEV